MASSADLFPEVLWAQRANEIYITINLADVTDPNIKLTPEALHFDGISHNQRYKVDLEFFKDVDPETSKRNITARSLVFVITKKEQDVEWWPRLLKKSGKTPHYIKTDFSKWRDEDDEEAEGGAGGEGGNPFDMDFSQFSNMGMGGGGMGGMPGMGGMGGMMGGMPGMGGMDMSGMDMGGDDSDDDELPKGGEDLEDDLPVLEPATAASKGKSSLDDVE
ncbi:hypothetical protein SmJEL517_g01188 [Synchytrium microbalum]|uniref:CS domain-containing protein n=1 Tax=Synchytrium microbalum TaxID=1806994 RepID=A0A507CF32_9FUNG|nr:uncharacterized protein SmJEL517_g01188 [Synchytrium microbalum]TPX36524.1 hypothetical protein SmJEL517_g01188 [Synchytrium microbalum]